MFASKFGQGQKYTSVPSRDFRKALRAKLALAMALASWLLPLGAYPQAAGSPQGIDVIKAYAGTWKIQIDTLDTPQSKSAHEETSLRNDCWASGKYYACNQYVDGDSKILLVFTYNPVKDLYISYQIPQDGSEASSGTLKIEGKTWTFPWQQTENGKVTYYRVVNVFAGPNRIEYRREFSADNAVWTVMAKGVENKIK